MDYVVAGFGIGAILALAGFALWELFGSVDEPGRGWLDRTAIGLMLGALVIWAVTGVTLFSAIDDSTGSHLVLLTTVVTVLAVVVVSFWYRRIERTLPAAGQPKRREAKVDDVVQIASPAPREIALTEWDTWPERDDLPADTTPTQEPTFEPEVATASYPVVAARMPTSDDDLERPEIRLAESELVDAADSENESATTSESDDIELEKPTTPVVSGSPENIQAFRPERTPERTMEPEPTRFEPEPAIVEPEQELPESESVTELPSEQSDEQEPVIDDDPFATAILPEESVDLPVAPAVFESSLLADIEIAPAEGDGRYRSPLLADLDPRLDELEEIGLARWRPEARLTAEDEAESNPPRKRTRK